MAEASFRRAMLISEGDVSVFWSNWLVGSICALAMVMLFWPAIGYVTDRLRNERKVAAG